MHLKKLHVFLAVAVAGLLWACGPMEPDAQQEELTISHQEYAFKHGPGTKAADGSYSYYITTFSGEGTACGNYADGKWYYTTGEWMFYCGAKLKLEANGKCVVVQVADNGPAAWVEANAKAKCGGTGYILDVSPLVTKYIWGVSSAGWSECNSRKVKAWHVADSTKTGPTSCGGTTTVDDGSSWIGESCDSSSDCSSNLTCNTQGHQDGMCTQSCTKYCPDASGKTSTFCVSADGANGQCYSRCNTSKYSGGCRDGYQCVNVPRFNEPGVKRDTCIPDDLVSQVLGQGGNNSGGSGNTWIGGACDGDSDCASGLMCNTQDHQDGMCTQECTKLCPDRSGETTTFCVALDEADGGYCYSRCDYNKFSSGCRQGYTCSKLPRYNQSSVQRNTCVPDSAAGKTDFIGQTPDEEGELPNPEDMFKQGGCAMGSGGALGGLPGLAVILLLVLVAARRRERQ